MICLHAARLRRSAQLANVPSVKWGILMQAGTSLREENWKRREVPYIKHYSEVLQISFHTV